jgi:hypothetical protein
MKASELLSDLTRRGIRLEPCLHVEAPKGALTHDERDALRLHKVGLLLALIAEASTYALPEPERCGISEVTPDSRTPLVASEIRAKIEAIETDARAKGWPAELLWNAGFWDSPRGLAAVLEVEDEIAEVRPDHIAILKTSHYLLRFQRYIG